MQSKMIRLSQLNIDENYQRGYRKAHVQKIVDLYDEHAFGRILVGRRTDGSLWVVDGQHRYYAAEQMGLPSIPAEVFDSNGQSHEAEIFLKANAARRVSGLDKLHAAYCAGVEWATDIVDSLAKRGLEMAFGGKKSKWPYIATTEPLMQLHAVSGKRGIEKLARVIVEGFTSHDPDATDQVVISGVAYFLAAWPDADLSRLIDVCSRKTHSAAKLKADANSINLHGGGNGRRKCAGQILWKWYNARLNKSKKLPAINLLEQDDE